MHTPETVNEFKNASKQELTAYIEAQRRCLSVDMAELHQAGNQVMTSGSEVLHHPVSTLSDTISHHLTSAQRWNILGAAFFLGGLCMYAARRREVSGRAPTLERLTAPSFVRPIIEPLATELAQAIRVAGRRLIKDLFKVPDEHRAGEFARLPSERTPVEWGRDSSTPTEGMRAEGMRAEGGREL